MGILFRQYVWAGKSLTPTGSNRGNHWAVVALVLYLTTSNMSLGAQGVLSPAVPWKALIGDQAHLHVGPETRVAAKVHPDRTFAHQRGGGNVYTSDSSCNFHKHLTLYIMDCLSFLGGEKRAFQEMPCRAREGGASSRGALALKLKAPLY